MEYRAREIYKDLGYVSWKNFNSLIERGKNLIQNSIRKGIIKDTTLSVHLGSNAIRNIKDYILDEDAFKLILDLSSSYKLNKCFSTRNETSILLLLKKYCIYKSITFDFQFNLKGYKYDFRAGNNLIEFDEPHHKEKRQSITDGEKNDLAKKCSYRIIRITLNDDIIDVIKKLNF